MGGLKQIVARFPQFRMVGEPKFKKITVVNKKLEKHIALGGEFSQLLAAELELMKEIKRIDSAELERAVKSLVNAISDRHGATEKLVIASIADGGIALGSRIAEALSEKLNRPIAHGTVNVSFHRDDIGRKPIPKPTQRTELPFTIEAVTVILVDDVLFTGRTVRAALNEIFDLGRPALVELAILCDRGNRRLPIQPDYLGFTEETTPEQKVVLTMDSSAEASENHLTIYGE